MSPDWLDCLRDRKGGPTVMLFGTVVVIVGAIMSYSARTENERWFKLCLVGLVIFIGVMVDLAVTWTNQRPEPQFGWIMWVGRRVMPTVLLSYVVWNWVRREPGR